MKHCCCTEVEKVSDHKNIFPGTHFLFVSIPFLYNISLGGTGFKNLSQNLFQSMNSTNESPVTLLAYVAEHLYFSGRQDLIFLEHFALCLPHLVDSSHPLFFHLSETGKVVRVHNLTVLKYLEPKISKLCLEILKQISCYKFWTTVFPM